MNVIHTTDDLLRLLNQNDEFRQAVRREVLSEELLKLPERFAKFETRVEGFIDEQRQFNQQTEDSIGEIRDTLAQHTEAIAQHTEAIREIRDTIAQQSKAINRQSDAIGELRGKAARYAVAVHFLDITEAMGFQLRGLVTRIDLGWMVNQRQRRDNDIPQNDLRSFFRADMVIEVADSEETTHYIAVEASYTADERDTSRAQRNAAILTQITGHPAHAAIASVRNVREIQPLLDDGTVYWYALEPADFTPE